MKIKNLIKLALHTAVVVLMLTVSAFADNNIGVVTGDVVNVRAGKSTDSEILTQVYEGSRYGIIAVDGLWTEIEYLTGKTGFIHNNYFRPAEQNGTVTGSYVYIREMPGTDSKILGGAYKGTVVAVKSVQGDWMEIEFEGSTAWMHGDYIKLDSEVRPTVYNEAKAENIIKEAEIYLGCPYVYGATGPNAFDCSGFTQFVFNKFGVSLPRVAANQAVTGSPVSKVDLKPGDLVFFQNRGYIDHVGIYIGNGQMIHSGSDRSGVCVASIDSSYFGPRYAGARRVI